MAKTINTKLGGEFKVYELPTFCPRCRRNAIPEILGQAAFSLDDENFEWTVDVPMSCGRCKLGYIAEYSGDDRAAGNADQNEDLEFVGTIPAAEPQVEVSDALAKVSPLFAQVYDEAVAAEVAGLEDLSGAGYRRALEFLVKDYLISKRPGDEQMFRRMALGSLIRDHIDEPEIKELAKEAVAIGNDFVHFSQYTKRDVQELRGLINLVWRWIELREEIGIERTRIQQARVKKSPPAGRPKKRKSKTTKKADVGR